MKKIIASIDLVSLSFATVKKMETKEHPLKSRNKRSKAGSSVQKAMVTLITMVAILAGCSKEDDSVDPVNPPADTTKDDIGVTVTVKNMVPESPAALKFGEDVEVTYDYDITRSDGARIWVFPYTNGNYTPQYKYELSPLYTGKGTKTVKFTVSEGDSVVVDQLRIQIGTGGYTLLGTVFWDPLEDLYETVSYTFTK
jgi:hypothetical protein